MFQVDVAQALHDKDMMYCALLKRVRQGQMTI